MRFCCAFIALALVVSPALAAGLQVAAPAPFRAALDTLANQYERETGTLVVAARGQDTPDIVIAERAAFAPLERAGAVVAGSETALARPTLAAAVRSGAPAPVITSDLALKTVLIKAKSIVYPADSSGADISIRLFGDLGLAEVVRAKGRIAPDVAAAVAHGDADIGLAPLSELQRARGLTVLGPLPKDLQKAPELAAGLGAKAADPDHAAAFIAFLAAPAAWTVLRANGLEPFQPAQDK